MNECKDGKFTLIYLRIDLKEEYFLSKESESRTFIENYRVEFGQYEDFLELVFDEPIDYLDPHRKDEILAILEWPIVSYFNFKIKRKFNSFNMINFIISLGNNH